MHQVDLRARDLLVEVLPQRQPSANGQQRRRGGDPSCLFFVGKALRRGLVAGVVLLEVGDGAQPEGVEELSRGGGADAVDCGEFGKGVEAR